MWLLLEQQRVGFIVLPMQSPENIKLGERVKGGEMKFSRMNKKNLQRHDVA
jgi:hypothetical protein